jgi:hypothetical protein
VLGGRVCDHLQLREGMLQIQGVRQ